MSSDYYKSKRMSVSKLKVLANDPVEFRMRYVDDPPTLKFEPTESMVFGSALHCAFLEPHKFDDDFAVTPKVDRRTKAGKEQYEEFLANLNGRTAIDEETYQEVIEAAQQLRSHRRINQWMGLATPDGIEREYQYDLYGLDFQSKLDVVIPPLGLILDLKTVPDIRPHKMRFQFHDFGYHIQAAVYRLANFVETGEFYRFIFIAIEKRTPSTRGMPFKIALYELDGDSISRGEMEAKSLVDDYLSRSRSGDWRIPYCTEEIVSLSTPSIPFGYRKETENE